MRGFGRAFFDFKGLYKMAEKKFSYDIDGNELHEFFKMHNQMSADLDILSNKILLLHILEGHCVELEQYKNKNYELLCMAIADAEKCCEELTAVSEKCSTHMKKMLNIKPCIQSEENKNPSAAF